MREAATDVTRITRGLPHTIHAPMACYAGFRDAIEPERSDCEEWKQGTYTELVRASVSKGWRAGAVDGAVPTFFLSFPSSNFFPAFERKIWKAGASTK